jgi:hypothetical protein
MLTTLHPLSTKELALTLPTSGGRSVGIVRSRTQATEFSFNDNSPEWSTLFFYRIVFCVVLLLLFIIIIIIIICFIASLSISIPLFLICLNFSGRI